MNAPFQPRSRAAMTPTSGGRCPVPSATASGSKIRRGFTPRSASRTKTVYGGEKPKLTVQQQLEIMQRLETGNFKKGVGLSQFYEEFGSCSSVANKMTCKQNLFSSFASVDPLASSTRNYGNGAGSMESLISVNSSIISSTTAVAVEDIDRTSVEALIPESRISETEEYNSLPDYIRAFDRLLATKENYSKTLEELAEVQCSTKFAQLLPQEKMVTFFKSLARVHKIIQKFLDGNASENMKLFMPSPKPKGPPPPVVHCDVESHSLIINAFYRLSEIMNKLDSYLKRGSADFKLEAKIESFKDLVNKLEDSINTQEGYLLDVRDMIKKTEILEMDKRIPRDAEIESYKGSLSRLA